MRKRTPSKKIVVEADCNGRMLGSAGRISARDFMRAVLSHRKVRRLRSTSFYYIMAFQDDMPYLLDCSLHLG